MAVSIYSSVSGVAAAAPPPFIRGHFSHAISASALVFVVVGCAASIVCTTTNAAAKLWTHWSRSIPSLAAPITITIAITVPIPPIIMIMVILSQCPSSSLCAFISLRHEGVDRPRRRIRT